MTTGHTHEGIQGLQLVCVYQLVVDGSQISYIVCLVGHLHTMTASKVDVGSCTHKIGGSFITRVPYKKRIYDTCC